MNRHEERRPSREAAVRVGRKQRIARELGSERRRRWLVAMGEIGAVGLVIGGVLYEIRDRWSFPVILILIVGLVLSLSSVAVLVTAGRKSDRKIEDAPAD